MTKIRVLGKVTGWIFLIAAMVSGEGVWAADFAGGTGEPNDPYQIATAEQLCSIGSDPNLLDKHYVLVDNIDLDPCLPGGQVFERAVIAPNIGLGSRFEGIAFVGSFNGQGYKIRGFTLVTRKRYSGDANTVVMSHFGLFGKIGLGGLVSRLTISDANVCGINFDPRDQSLGILAGASEGCVSSCKTSGTVSGSRHVGGIIGWNSGELSQCRSTSSVIGTYGVGGVLGYNEGDVIECVWRDGVVTGGDNNIGGLMGYNQGNVEHCQSSGLIKGRGRVGGLIGLSNVDSTIMDCNSVCHIFSEGSEVEAGGLVGNNNGAIYRCHSNSVVIGSGEGFRVGGAFGINYGE